MTADGSPGADGDELPSGLDLPADEGGPAFEAPCQARAFATVVALHRRGAAEFDWADFQSLLAAEIETTGPPADPGDVEGAYYARWLRAAERLLVQAGVLETAAVDARAAEFAAGERNAQEFIEGEHQEAHDHPHGHEHDHSNGQGHGHSNADDHADEHADHGNEHGRARPADRGPSSGNRR